MFQFKLGSAKPDGEFGQDDSDQETSHAGSKRKRSTRKTVASSHTSRAPIASALLHSSAAPVYLKSAWKPKALTIRPSVQTNPCKFIRTTAAFNSDTCHVEMQVQSNFEETIDVAAAWEQGQDGYSRTGFTK